MPKAILYLLRHGRAGPPGILLGQSDPDLSPAGEAEALAWRPFFRLHPPQAVWTSPLLRARRTAQLVLGEEAPPLVNVEELREIRLGAWEGRSAQEARALDPKLWEARGTDPSKTPPGGESFTDLSLRVLPAFAALGRQIRGLRAGLLVAHQAVNRIILAETLGLGPEAALGLRQDYARLSILAFGPEKARLLACNLAPEDSFSLCQ
ncbi:MAG: histidine phosphatase family protein [Deltaproteobacteria bacterium]|jgi:probable phosphoglycerate mutase|nr:histidine phosphatase family protein [Deltaproteobacteria bacterium]